jgi:hypothetical protein
MSDAQIRFYGVNIEVPLSLAHNTTSWNNSVIGQLNAKTEGEVYIREIPQQSRNAAYGWRVVDAVFSDEDSTMTYFKAYDTDGDMLPQAIFGINYTSVPSQIGGGFNYPPEFGNRYYIPAQNNFHTPNTGGMWFRYLIWNTPVKGWRLGCINRASSTSVWLFLSD